MLLEKQIHITPIAGRHQPVIAIIGSDGSGKSTIGNALYVKMLLDRPTKFCHLGKQAGNLGRSIKKLPIIGRLLSKRTTKEKNRLKKKKISSFLSVILAFIMSMRRVYRFICMRYYHNHGYAILTDRFPQILIPGPMDGPSLANLTFNGWFLHKLMKFENWLYKHMTEFQPDLIIRLNVPLELAISRKLDHAPQKLARKISDASRLHFGAVPIIDLDSAEPLEQVIDKGSKAVYEVMSVYPVNHL